MFWALDVVKYIYIFIYRDIHLQQSNLYVKQCIKIYTNPLEAWVIIFTLRVSFIFYEF